MQDTTRSEEEVEGVGVAKAMASGGTVLPSASAGGKPSVVVNTGGGRSYKRKGLPGGHYSNTSSTLGQKKKLCSSSRANEMAKVTQAAAVKSINSNGGGIVAMKKLERIDDGIVGDPSLEDAARALTEFSFLAHKPARTSPAPKPNSSYQSRIPILPQWKTTKLRSGRAKRLEGSSNEGSHLAIASDSSNQSPLPLEKQHPQHQQVSECSCSPGGDSQSVITLVKVEDEPLCSSTGVEEEEQVEQLKVEVVAEVHEEKSLSRCPSDPERLPKLASVSSIESFQPDSQAESPSSPLPAVLRTGEFSSMCVAPQFDGSSPTGRSAFKRVVPIRPVKKPSLSRKLKVEEKTFEDLNPEQAAVKHVSRKKPRPTGFVPLQQLQELQQEHPQQQQLAPVKIEEGDVCALALGPPGFSAVEEAEVKRIGVASTIALPATVAVDEKTVKLDIAVVKVETKPLIKLGQRASSKAKPALSESEKEARKLRRVQANRESARLTIRKKQVLCEELTRKAEFLTAENALFREEMARIREKNKSLSEMNGKISEQVAKASGKLAAESSSPTPSPMEKPLDGIVQYQFPPQFGGLPPMCPPYFWAFAMAQAAQAAGVPTSEINMGSAEYTALFAAATAAACGSNSPAGFWSMASSSQGQSLPPFYAGHLPGASVASASPSSCGTPANVAPIMRSVSLPVAPTDGSLSLVASERPLASGKAVASYRSGDFSDSVHLSHELKRNSRKQDSTHLGSGYSGKTHYFQMPSGSHAGTAVTGGVTTATRKPEGGCLPMPNASGQLLSRSHSLSTTHVSKLHSRYPMFGSGGMCMTQEQPSARESEAQRKGAAATEARRKRIELKRTKSFLSRQQVARVAEPSA